MIYESFNLKFKLNCNSQISREDEDQVKMDNNNFNNNNNNNSPSVKFMKDKAAIIRKSISVYDLFYFLKIFLYLFFNHHTIFSFIHIII